MMKIKNVVLICCSFMFVGCTAMDTNDRDLNHHIAVIGGQIDKKILGINENAWHTPIVGSCTSFYNSFSFFNNPQQAMRQLSAVETVIQEASDRTYSPKLFETLHTKHWHFAYLVNALVDDEIKQLRQADGFTIDMLCDKKRKLPQLSHLLSAFIHTRAHDCYGQEVGLKKPITEVHFGGENGDEEEIHFMALMASDGWTWHEPCTLIMSDDNKYLRSMTSRGKQVIWNIEHGIEVENSCMDTDEGRQCFKDGCLIDAKESVLALCGDRCCWMGWRMRVLVKKYHEAKSKNIKPAKLFVRPTLTSWLCQQIFLKNKNNKDQLIALRGSQAVKNIEGFPQKNLLRLIDDALSKELKLDVEEILNVAGCQPRTLLTYHDGKSNRSVMQLGK